MRKILLTLCIMLSIIVCAAPGFAGDPAGEVVNDSTYLDSEYGFSFTKPDTWKFQEIYSKGDIDRVVLVQNAPVVPAQFAGEMKSFFTQPRVTILACPAGKLSSGLKPKEYAEFLLAEDGKDDLKKKAYGRFQLLQMDSEYSFQAGRPRSIKIGGHHAASVAGKKKYYYAFEAEHGRSNVVTLNDYISGFIYIVEATNGMLLIECVCERELFEQLEPDFERIIDTFSFDDAVKGSSEESGG